ncbi:Protein grainyhead [Eumeta japonica]|uniref:Protein grainyhead n=1 Tax=Eumeta variegata TaxID=151549 RepID=A0A4C1VF22_EUMVA|nr:Protein grainyhead [Eumeta japonica]
MAGRAGRRDVSIAAGSHRYNFIRRLGISMRRRRRRPAGESRRRPRSADTRSCIQPTVRRCGYRAYAPCARAAAPPVHQSESVVMLVFREEKSPEDEIKAWQFWHGRQHSVKQRILDAGRHRTPARACETRRGRAGAGGAGAQRATRYAPAQCLLRLHTRLRISCVTPLATSTLIMQIFKYRETQLRLGLEKYDVDVPKDRVEVHYRMRTLPSSIKDGYNSSCDMRVDSAVKSRLSPRGRDAAVGAVQVLRYRSESCPRGAGAGRGRGWS